MYRQMFIEIFLWLLFAFAGQYPAHWWTPVSDAQKPAWEILPQAAKPGEVILSKRNELGILSNFAATPFTFRGVRYASVEGFWQMMLYPEGSNDPRAQAPFLKWPHTRAEVAQMTAFQAKAAGDIAEENMHKLGYRLGDVRRPAYALPFHDKGRTLSFDCRSYASQTCAEPQGARSLAVYRELASAAGSHSGSQCPAGMGVLQDLDGHSNGTTA